MDKEQIKQSIIQQAQELALQLYNINSQKEQIVEKLRVAEAQLRVIEALEKESDE